TAGDFRLTLKVKLVPDLGNSGVQFRSEALPGGDVKGYQADVGAGWWGKLYEEHGRGLLGKKAGAPLVRAGDWNDYEIVAVRGRRRERRGGRRGRQRGAAAPHRQAVRGPRRPGRRPPRHLRAAAAFRGADGGALPRPAAGSGPGPAEVKRLPMG